MKLRETNLWEEVDKDRNDILVGEITHGSERKIWWKGRCGHQWKASVYNRVRLGRGCPYCAGKIACSGNSVADIPRLAKEWDEKKNTIGADKVTPSSGEKAWWTCEKGHSWLARVYSRKKNGCPVCGGKTTQDCSFASEFPVVASEMNIERSGFRPDSIRPHSNKKAWWKCRVCGFEWKIQINQRTSKHSGCPQCCRSGVSKLSLRFYCELLSVFSDAKMKVKIGKWKCDIHIPSHNIVVEVDGSRWHGNVARDKEKTQELHLLGCRVIRARSQPLMKMGENDVVFDERTEAGIFDGTRRVIQRVCSLVGVRKPKKHDAFINDRLYRKMLGDFAIGAGMGMLDKRPDLILEWDESNGEDPTRLRYGSTHKIWWKCSKGHRWQDSPYHRVRGSNCHFCSGRKVGSSDNSFASMFPDVVSEWHSEKNQVGPYDIVAGSNKQIWWKCAKGHEWKVSPANRAKGRGCPYCTGRLPTDDNNLKVLFPEVAAEWNYQKNRTAPEDYLSQSNKKVWWICQKCCHSWESIISNRTKGHGCPECGKKKCVQSRMKNRGAGCGNRWRTSSDGETESVGYS